jgi:TonB-dependent SusC/RagA subfamily outer membrane receptor
MKLKTFLLFLLFVLFLGSIAAQKNNNKITITGTVMFANGTPVANAIIMIDNHKTKSRTDSEGNYKIRVKPDAVTIGIFTFGNGYYEEEIGGRTRIYIDFNAAPYLPPLGRNTESGEEGKNVGTRNNSNYGVMGLRGQDTPPGEESVEVGYAHMKKKYLSTDITFIDGTKIKYGSCTSVADMIQRNVPGVMITPSGGVILQGSADLFGAVGPLVIVDDMPGSLNDVPPSWVKSISVLKGTAAAIYGSRGFGGVIIVKTKDYDDFK